MPLTNEARLRTLPPVGDRIPPHDLIAEASLLGAMLLSTDALAAGAETCSAADFYKPAHARVFEAIVALDQRGEPADPTTVADELRRRGELETLGGMATVVSLQANTPSTANAERYGRIVRDHALMRALIGVSGELAELGFSRPADVGGALDAAEAKLFTVAQRQVTDSLAGAPELVHGFLDDLEAVMDSPTDLLGLPTGLGDLDRLLLGLHPSTLNILAARPAMGKTALALGIAAHVAGVSGKPVLFFSLEMSQRELTQRLVAAKARVDGQRLRTGRLSGAELTAVYAATDAIARWPLVVDHHPYATVMEMRAKARRLRARQKDLGLIVVDYLQLMHTAAKAERRDLELAEISRGLKLLARDLDVPVLALSQLTRNVEQRGDKRPVLADLRESGAIEADADVVVFLYRDEVYYPDSPDRGIAELIIGKHRSGPTGTARAAFIHGQASFARPGAGVGATPAILTSIAELL
ncbi:MAG TPA: replicative DNA helicase [Mycobacteriales bacterium]|nr:replicative DNA helicase [Mycobacteriales bacterium]